MLNYTRGGKTYSVDPNELPKESIQYLLQYGWAQSLQDSIAGREKKVLAEIKGRVEEGVEQLDDDEIMAQVAMDIEAALGKRMDSIVAGTIGTRVAGEPRDPLKAVAADMIRKAAMAKKVKLSKERVAELVSEALADETKRAKVQAEYNRRKELDLEVEL